MKQHLKGCDHVEVDCACGAKIERRLMHTHGENVCPEATVDCPYNTHGCDADVLRKDLDDHMSEEGGAHAQLLAAELSATQSKLDATNSMLEATKTKLNGTQSKLDETTANLGMRLAALERQSTAARKTASTHSNDIINLQNEAAKSTNTKLEWNVKDINGIIRRKKSISSSTTAVPWQGGKPYGFHLELMFDKAGYMGAYLNVDHGYCKAEPVLVGNSSIKLCGHSVADKENTLPSATTITDIGCGRGWEKFLALSLVSGFVKADGSVDFECEVCIAKHDATTLSTRAR